MKNIQHTGLCNSTLQKTVHNSQPKNQLEIWKPLCLDLNTACRPINILKAPHFPAAVKYAIQTIMRPTKYIHGLSPSNRGYFIQPLISYSDP